MTNHEFDMHRLIATKVGFGQGVLEAGQTHKNLVVLGADITASVGLDAFAKHFPERFFSFGIAEQNCIGVAAGMALSGLLPVFSTYGVFAALRTTDQIRILLCYNNLGVIIGGAHAGLSVGPDGATHQALEDIAIMRVLPNMTVINPCDATQAHRAVLEVAKNIHGPVYIRFGREPVPDFTTPDMDFEIGKAQILRTGNDLAIIASGHMVWEGLQAAYILQKKGINCRVINLHTIKPIDQECIRMAAKECGRIVTVEEHQVAGGVGSAVAEVVVQHHPVPMCMIGVNDSFGESGQPEELLVKYGLNCSVIVDKILHFIQNT
jgi:transketolase